MRLSKFRRAAVLTLTAGALLGSSGCFGSFNMTRKVYGFNKTVSNDKFIRELVFLGLNVVPIYGIASFIDAIVLNTVEFWTGTNPMQMSSTIKLDKDTKVVRVVEVKDGVRTMTLTAYKFGQLAATTTVQYEPGSSHMTFATVYPDGRTETHVAALSTDGKAFVASGTYAELVHSGAIVEY